ncbi:MAG: AAA family ATPase [Clostridiales Family XIII bacterium]|nr:AAA family ATPase [Clostridiales Family XIII bacterium]
MGIPVLILGSSGTGKSSSMRNFKESDVCVLNVAGKPLPFKGKLSMVNNATYESIGEAFKKHKFKRYVVDDSQYLLAFDMFARAKETGYGKFTDMAIRFKNMISYVAQKTPDNVVVYFLHHTEETDTGKIKAKTVGKMLDNQLTVEGMFSIVLLTHFDGTAYKFITQTDGVTPAKSPMGMFEKEIDNDLVFVDKTIREYWGIK